MFTQGFEWFSTIFFAIDEWIYNIWESIGGFMPIILIIAGMVLLFWISRTAGLHVRSSDTAKYKGGNNNR